MGGTMSQLMRWQNEEGTTLEDRQSWRNASLSIQYISEYRIPQQKRTIKSKQLPKKKNQSVSFPIIGLGGGMKKMALPEKLSVWYSIQQCYVPAMPYMTSYIS